MPIFILIIPYPKCSLIIINQLHYSTATNARRIPASVEIVINKQGINAFLCNNFNGIFPFLLFAVFITFGKPFKGKIGSNRGRKTTGHIPCMRLSVVVVIIRIRFVLDILFTCFAAAHLKVHWQIHWKKQETF